MFVKQLTRYRRIGKFFCIPFLVLFCITAAISQNDGLSCIGSVNLSLDAKTCSASITPDMLVNPSDYNTSVYSYEVIVTNLSDVAIDNQFGIESLGSKYKAGARSTDLITGNVSNLCWSYVTMEYKFVPEIECISPATGSGSSSMTGSGTGAIIVSCLANPANYPRPTFTSSCGVESEVIQVGIDAVENVCDPADPETVAKITRSYQAVNVFGGFSNICTVEYHVKVFELSQVVFPNIATIGGCSDDDVLTDPANLGIPFHLSPTGSGSLTMTGSGIGVTTFDTTYLYPTPPSACNILVSLENDTIAQDECEIKVLRKWTIQQWLCNNEEKIAQREQLITLRDTDGPAFTCPTDTIQARASGTTCKAFVNMPSLQVDESCSAVRSVSMSFLPEGTLSSNGGTISLPVGIHTVTYIASDECNNESTCEVIVNVNDGAPPVVICEQHVAISLTNNGTAHVPASVFDDGSYGCGFSHVMVAKMQDICGDTVVLNPSFADHIKLCCDEALSPPMVRLRAYNHDGSYNECMAEITINDKNPVSLVCPTSLEVSCDFVYDDSLAIFGTVATTLSDRNSIVIDAESVTFDGGLLEGKDGLATGGCGMVVLEDTNIDASTISCGTGTIRRTFTLSNGSDTKTCTQTINIVGGNDFDGLIAWPKDTTIDIACGVADISANLTGRPTFTEGDCQQLAATYVDETFTNVEVDGTCRKIFRYWTIIDWCNTDPDSGLPKRYPETTEGRQLQVIKIVKNQKPVVQCVGDTLFESVEPSCLVSDVNLSATVSGCPNTTEYVWEYLLDIDCDGSVDSVGQSATYTDTVIAGDHCITWYATDLCGNISAPCTHNFKVRNNKGPSAVCIANLTVALDSMDLLGNDGILDTVMAVIWADDIDSGSSQSCGNPISFSFSSDSIVNGMEFTCDDANRRVRVGLYVFDDLTGAVSECWTEIEVQDPYNRCVVPIINECATDTSVVYLAWDNHAVVSQQLTGNPITGNIPAGQTNTVTFDSCFLPMTGLTIGGNPFCLGGGIEAHIVGNSNSTISIAYSPSCGGLINAMDRNNATLCEVSINGVPTQVNELASNDGGPLSGGDIQQLLDNSGVLPASFFNTTLSIASLEANGLLTGIGDCVTHNGANYLYPILCSFNIFEVTFKICYPDGSFMVYMMNEIDVEPSSNSIASVSGLLATESGESITQAEVSLLGSELPENTTNLNGQYAFDNMPMGGAYTVMAHKDQDHINGVSTLDLVMIQKHILGLDLLDSPYKMIAADINNNNSISAADIVELRKLILGEQAEFVNNTSWRFIDKEYEFPQPSSPWSELFPEDYDITSLDNNMNIDFVGVKVGDVSGNASANNFNLAELRNSSEPLKLISAYEIDDANSSIVFNITSTNFENVSGFQTTLSFDPSQLSFEGVQSENINISLDNVGTTQAERGMITLSWSSADEVTLNEDAQILSLKFIGKKEGIRSIAINSDLTQTEAYFNGNITNNITLDAKTILGLRVAQNEPNPWKDQTDIKFEIRENGYVGFNVIDLTGKLIISKSNYFSAGANKIQLERQDLPNGGLYFYELYSQGQKVTKKMIVLD